MLKVTLPMQRTGSNLSFPEKAMWLLFGPPKSGKTTAACTWPEPLLLNCEPGGDLYVEAYKLQINNLAELESAVSQLTQAAPRQFPYQTVILDTLDVVADWMEEAVCKEFNEKRLGEAKVFGADFSAHRMMVLNLLTRLSALPFSVVLVAHSRALPTEGEPIKTIDLPGKLARSVMAAVSHIAFLECRTLPNGAIDRRFWFLPTGLVESGSRHPVLTQARYCPPTYQAIVGLFADVGTENNAHKSKQPIVIGLPAKKAPARKEE